MAASQKGSGIVNNDEVDKVVELIDISATLAFMTKIRDNIDNILEDIAKMKEPSTGGKRKRRQVKTRK
jgi:hypothetical protein